MSVEKYNPMDDNSQESGALAIVQKFTPAIIFMPGGGNPIIEEIKNLVADFEPDLTTEKGRKDISSMAYKIARAKTRLEEMRKAENKELQDRINATNAEGKRINEAVQQIQDDVRKPLTEWENANEARIEGHRQALANLEAVASSAISRWDVMPFEELQFLLKQTQEYTRQWEEFSYKAKSIQERSISTISDMLEKRIKYDAEQAEIVRIKTEEAARIQKEREEQIARKAAEDARKEAEFQAETLRKQAEEEVAKKMAEQERKAREEMEAAVLRERQAEEEIHASLRREKDALEAKERAERFQKEAEEKATRDIIEAEIRAKEQAELAVKIERERIEAQARIKADEEAKRQADEQHRQKIHFEIATALRDINTNSLDAAKLIVIAIADGKIPHVSIKY